MTPHLRSVHSGIPAAEARGAEHVQHAELHAVGHPDVQAVPPGVQPLAALSGHPFSIDNDEI